MNSESIAIEAATDGACSGIQVQEVGVV